MEIIEREIKAKKDQFPPDFQVSLNSWGHLMLRWFDRTKPDKDVVIVLSQNETEIVLRFLRSLPVLFRTDP